MDDQSNFVINQLNNTCTECGKKSKTQLCDDCNDRLLEEMDKENEARRDYIANGGSARDF